MGLTAGQAPEYIADAAVLETSSGAHAVNLQQRYKRIPIFQADVMVRFAVDGRIHDTTGSIITVNGDVSTRRKLSVQEATLAAATAFSSECGGDPIQGPVRRDHA
jgi:extracellular elastinolytic metalloproteinase